MSATDENATRFNRAAEHNGTEIATAPARGAMPLLPGDSGYLTPEFSGRQRDRVLFRSGASPLMSRNR